MEHQRPGIWNAHRESQVPSKGSEILSQKDHHLQKGSGKANGSSAICVPSGSNMSCSLGISVLVSSSPCKEVEERYPLSSSPRTEEGPLSLAQTRHLKFLPSSKTSSCVSGDFHRRFLFKLGRPCVRRSETKRDLVPVLQEVPHRCFTAGDGFPSSKEASVPKRLTSPSSLGQYDSCQLPQQVRICKISSPKQLDSEHPFSGGKEKCGMWWRLGYPEANPCRRNGR